MSKEKAMRVRISGGPLPSGVRVQVQKEDGPFIDITQSVRRVVLRVDNESLTAEVEVSDPTLDVIAEAVITHHHQWIEITRHGESPKTRMCGGCGAIEQYTDEKRAPEPSNPTPLAPPRADPRDDPGR